MRFKTLQGNQVNLGLAAYRIDWNKPSLSKFQTRVKEFFRKNYSAAGQWYEEVPLVGKGVSRMRFDFLWIYENKWGKEKKIFVEVQGQPHYKKNAKFHPTQAHFDDQLLRDELKILYAVENSDHALVEIFEDDVLTLGWFVGIYPQFGT